MLWDEPGPDGLMDVDQATRRGRLDAVHRGEFVVRTGHRWSRERARRELEAAVNGWARSSAGAAAE